MTINEYLESLKKESRDQRVTRLLISPNKDIANLILSSYKTGGAVVLRVYEYISQESVSWLSMPDEVFSRLDAHIRQENRNDNNVVVVGLDAYLALLKAKHVTSAFAKLHHLIDVGEINAVFIVSFSWTKDIRSIFENPKYESGRQVVFFDGDPDNKMSPNVVLVDREFLKTNETLLGSFWDYLRSIGDFTAYNDNRMIIAMPSVSEVPGINPAVRQLFSLAEFMRFFYHVEDELPETVLRWILEKAQALNCDNALEAIRLAFEVEDDLLDFAPKLLAENQDETAQAAFSWMLKHTVPQNSYLSYVLSLSNVSLKNFLQSYIVDGAIHCLNVRDKRSENFARERRLALREIGGFCATYINNFISASRLMPIEDVAIWLNNEALGEHVELVRRCSTKNPSDNVPVEVLKTYPQLSDYLAENVFSKPELELYFKRYRKLKLWNTITPEFAKEALEIPVPHGIRFRDTAIQELASDMNCALLVVDGLGAEYLPMILASAKRHHIMAIKYETATVNLPSSTEFNEIKWVAERRLSNITRIDEIAHDGVNEHEKNDYALNLVTVIDDMIAGRVFNAIAEGLTRFKRVVLTADHGSSRLAVLSHKEGFSETLTNPGQGKPTDWRYTDAPCGKTCPPEMEDTLDGKYWVVRGYNRLPKEGGKKNELHGGASLEERLVPIVVFEKDAAYAKIIAQAEMPSVQLKEKDDFDI